LHWLLTNKNKKIPNKQTKFGDTASTMSGKEGVFSDMTSEGLGEMFEGESADTHWRERISFFVINLFFSLAPVVKIIEGVVVAFRNCAGAPN
jgi:hypothetical protein